MKRFVLVLALEFGHAGDGVTKWMECWPTALLSCDLCVLLRLFNFQSHARLRASRCWKRSCSWSNTTAKMMTNPVMTFFQNS
jgi:hypothetical protein